MTNEIGCTFGDRRDEALIAYLYDEVDSRERTAFERHLSTCAPCRLEVGALSDVRDQLATWAAPDVADGIGGTAPRAALRLVEPARDKGWKVFADAPIWMQAAAAMLVVAASLGLANINLTYTHDGLSVTTGWMRAAAAPAANATTLTATSAQAPWRADITALQQQVNRQIAAMPALAVSSPAPSAPAPAVSSDEAVMRRVRAMLQESERRQQSELALRVAEMARDTQAQRQVDLMRIDRTLGVLQNRTGVEVMRTQQQLNSLAQRVSEQR